MQIRIFDKRTLIVSNAEFHFMISRAYDNAPITQVKEVIAYRKNRRHWIILKGTAIQK